MKVAIIGAGITGLTIARKLVQRGVTVNVFEKSRGVGGRLATKRLDWGSFDIGAQYFTVRDGRFQQQVLEWQSEGVVAPWDFTPHALTPSGLVSSPDNGTRYVGIPQMNSLAHSLAAGIDITFSAHVTALNFTDSGWQLSLSTEKSLAENYDWVVLTIPAEQSKPLLAGTAIENKIPEHIHEPCWALTLATKGKVSSDIQGIFGDEIISWASRLSARPQREITGHYDNLWMLHFSSQWSTQHDKDTRLDIQAIGHKWLCDSLGHFIQQPLEVVHSHKHYWRYARLEDDRIAIGVIADRVTGIAAAGAWCSGGRVEGAYLSGLSFIDYLFGSSTSAASLSKNGT